MKYFGIPTCPYCKKRVNIIRIWSIKKHGEYMCPRCKGISNIFLSPLIYVLAVLVIASAFLLYFFQKFILDSITISSCLQIFIPFIAFFFFSLFMVYFEKPVIKRIRKTADGKYFDQNGNEMKMKMGKLVVENSEKTKSAAQNFSSSQNIRNEEDRSGREYHRPSVPFKQDVFSQEDKKLFVTDSDLLDNEALYAGAANKLGREFTIEVDPKAIKAKIFEKTAVTSKIIQEPPIKIAETPQIKSPVNPVKTPKTEIKNPTETVKISEATPKFTIESDTKFFPVEQPEKSLVEKKDDFANLIAEYDKRVNSPEKREPLPKAKKLQDNTKGNGFRQL